MKIEERKQSRELRTQGCSIKEISRRLKIAKSSASLWTRDIELTEEQKQNLSDRKAVTYQHILNQSKKNMEEAKARHSQYAEEGKFRCEKDNSFKLLCALYWGEGSKKKNTFCLTNSSIEMLKIIGDWLVKEGFENKIRFNISYHLENAKTEEEITLYWMTGLKWLSRDKINKMTCCIINRSSQKKRIGKLPFGTAQLCVHNTRLVNMVRGGIEYIKQMGL